MGFAFGDINGDGHNELALRIPWDSPQNDRPGADKIVFLYGQKEKSLFLFPLETMA